MNFKYENANNIIGEIVKGKVIDLSKIIFIDPWAIILLCLKLIENHNLEDKKIILPVDSDLLCYLKRIHFGNFLVELGYEETKNALDRIEMPERENLNIHELSHCNYRDEFDGRLPRFMQIFQNFGLDINNAAQATTLIGELGNNTFDHNLGSWPTDISGNIIIAQNYPKLKKIQIVVGDPGVGFLGSMQPAYPELTNDLEAIKKGLSGFTGRIGEKRGNGLKLIQQWTINDFYGIVSIQSGAGLIDVNADGMEKREVQNTLGTIAQLMIRYK